MTTPTEHDGVEHAAASCTYWHQNAIGGNWSRSQAKRLGGSGIPADGEVSYVGDKDSGSDEASEAGNFCRCSAGGNCFGPMLEPRYVPEPETV